MIIAIQVRRNKNHKETGFNELVIITNHRKPIVLRTQRSVKALLGLFPDCFTAQEQQIIRDRAKDAEVPPDIASIHQYEAWATKEAAEAAIKLAAQSPN